MSERFSPDPDNRKPFAPTEALRSPNMGRFSVLEQFKDNPNYLLKTVSGASREIADQYSGESSIEKTSEILGRMKQSALGRFLPETKLVIGETEPGDTKLFMVTERIQGKQLNYTETITTEIGEDIDELLASNAEFYKDSFDDEASIGYSLDIFGFDTNILIGRNMAKEDTEDSVYFVDAFPVFKLAPDHLIESYEPAIRRLESRQLNLPKTKAVIAQLAKLLG